MTRQYNSYSDEMLINAVKISHSLREVLGKIGLSKAGGGNYKTVRFHINRLELDTSHFLGKAHLKGKTHNYTKPKYSLEMILVKDSPYRGSHTRLKKRLFKAGMLERKCSNEGCPVQEPIWLGRPITFHLDHINGVNTDYRLSNLRLLCPSCHAQTPTYCGRNKKIGRKPFKAKTKKPRKPKRKYSDEEFKEAVKTSTSFKEVCKKIGLKEPSIKTVRSYAKELNIDTSHFAVRGGVSDQALTAAVKNSTSMIEICREVGLSETTAHSYVWRRIRNLGLDTSHFTRRKPTDKAQSKP